MLEAVRERAPTNAECALALAAAGLPVFPCDGRLKPEAEQRYPGEPRKNPLTSHGFKDATTDAETVAAWWRRYPDALPGVPTGESSGLFIIDADIDRETGEATGETTLAAFGLTPANHQFPAQTRSGGWHFPFRWRPDLPRNSVKHLPGVDIRGEGGYVIAWTPQTLIAAHGAVDLDGPPGAVLKALAEAKAQPDECATASGFRFDAGGGATAWAKAALDEEVAVLRGADEGGRNDALNRAAFNLGQLVGGGHLDRDRVDAELRAAAHAIGLGKLEIAKTIESGLKAGMAQPRGPKDGAGAGLRSGAQAGAGRAQDGAGGQVWPDPDMSLLEQERRPAPPFPLAEVFTPALARWIADEARARSAPVDYVAMALLATAGACIGNARWVRVHPKWQEPPVIWAAIIGNPSDNKSPALDAVIDPLSEIERRRSADFEAEHAAWREREELATIARAAWQEQVKAEIKKGGEPPEKPKSADPGPEPIRPRLRLNNATTEKLGAILAEQWRGVLQMRDELAGWLRGMDAYKAGGDREFWLEANGGRSYRVERQKHPVPITVDRLTVAVLGGIQPDKVASLMLGGDDDGLLARFMSVWPEPVPLQQPGATTGDAFAERLLERLLSLSPAQNDDGSPRPFFVPLTPDAVAMLYEDFGPQATAWEAEADGLMKGHIGKFRGFVIRLALILLYLDWAASDDLKPPSQVTEHELGRACHMIAEYLRPMALRVYGDAAAPAEERAAKRIARIIAEERPATINARDIQRRKLTGLRAAKDIEAGIKVLVQASWLRAEKVATGGRDRIDYRVNPALLGGDRV